MHRVSCCKSKSRFCRPVIWATQSDAAISCRVYAENVAGNLFMAPRFIEVSRPVEASVKFASSIPRWMTSKLHNALYPNITAVVSESVHNVMESLPDIKFLTDLKYTAALGVDLLPIPNKEVTILLTASVGALVLRYLFVFVRSRSILSSYGAAKVVSKEH